jgi:peptide/nickel transport system permease protein
MEASFPIFAVRRLLTAALLAVVVSALTFLTLHGMYPEAFGDTQPLFVELWHFLGTTFLHHDLGKSVARPLGPVSTLIGRGLAADFSLLVGAMAFGLLAGAAGGAVCARHPGSWRAKALDLAALLVLCAPVYVIGMASVLVFKPGIGAPLPIGILPDHGYVPLTENPRKWLHALIVPWVVTGAPLAAVCLRMTRASMIDIRDADFIRTATAKGLTPVTVTSRHVLPVALPPVVSLAGAYTPLLIGNVVLTEKGWSTSRSPRSIHGCGRDATRARAGGAAGRATRRSDGPRRRSAPQAALRRSPASPARAARAPREAAPRAPRR